MLTRLLRTFPVAATILSSVFAAAPSSASPWSRARAAGGTSPETLSVLAERSRAPREDRNFRPEDHALLSKRAALMLQIAHAERSDNEGLAYLFADALFEAGDGFHEPAYQAIHRALELFPESPHAAAAWANLGALANDIDEAGAARESFTHSLDLTWHEELRAQLFLLRAEASMRLGDVPAALGDYRAVMASATLGEYVVRAKWGAAVALERSFDLPEALRLAREASAVRFSNSGVLVGVLDISGMSFRPAYEEHYYRALAVMADALAEPDRLRAAEAFQTASFLWSVYVADARRQTTDATEPPWIENAERHRARCAARAEDLGDKVAPLPL